MGLKAALAAGMRCAITCHSGTVDQDFVGAECVLEDMSNTGLNQLLRMKGVDQRAVRSGA